MGRDAAGVRGVKLGKNDEVVGLLVVPRSNGEAAGDSSSDDDAAEAEVADVGGPMVLVVTANGFGKRTPVSQYRLTRRGGKGVKNIKMTARNGDVVGMLCVEGDGDVMFITERGIVIRTRVAEIGAYGRAAAGVRLMRLDDGDRLVAMAKIDSEAQDEGNAAETPAPRPAD
jgi:DNA gyrase subunit A